MRQTSLEHVPGNRQETRIDKVTERFLKDPDELRLLLELRDKADKAWRTDGFAAPDLFVNDNGNPILIAGKETNAMDENGENAYRLLYNLVVEDFVVPRALQGFAVTTQGSGGYEGIYTLKPEEDPLSQTAGETDLGPVDIPPALKALRKRFGDKLGIEEAGAEQGAERSLVSEVNGEEVWSAQELDGVIAKVEQMIELRNSDYTDAEELEAKGRRAARQLKVGWFATLRGKAKDRRAAAYKAVVHDGDYKS